MSAQDDHDLTAALDGIWADDLLDRRADADYLRRFLVNRAREKIDSHTGGSIVVNVDARWGTGKTFFLKHFQRDLELRDYRVAYVNAWEDDYAADPLIPIISAVEEAFRSEPDAVVAAALESARASALKVLGRGFIAGGRALARHLIGDTLDDISAAIGDAAHDGARASAESVMDAVCDAQSEALNAQFDAAKRSIAEFRGSLSALVEKLDGPLFVFVDEVDRCRPSYALALLERIKHLFGVDGIVFVIATDTEQLQHAACAVYGQEFDGKRYLFRFFDRGYSFAEPDLGAFVESLFANPHLDLALCSSPEDDHQRVFRGFARAFNLGIRDCEQCFDLLRTVLTTWPFKAPAELLCLMPYIVAHQQGLHAELNAMEVGDLSAIQKHITHDKSEAFLFRYRSGPDPFQFDEHDEPVSRLAFLFLSTARTPLPETTRDASSGPSGWIRGRLLAEFGALHGNQHSINNPPTSVIADYGRLVRGAGRLARFED